MLSSRPIFQHLFYQTMHPQVSVDSLFRDGTNTPIVCVHWRTVSTRERSRSKLSVLNTVAIISQRFVYPTIPPKWLKYISRLTDRQPSNRRFVQHLLLLVFKQPTSELAEVIVVVLAQVPFTSSCVCSAFY